MSSAADAFASLRSALETASIRFAIGGSWASTAFGEPRCTNDVDVLADFTTDSLPLFLASLPKTCYVDHDVAINALRLGRPFNVIYMPLAFKFNLFPAGAFPLGKQELDRAVFLAGTEISESPTPFVSPEDVLLAKLHCFRLGGEVSEVQWRDVQGIVRTCGATLDRDYLTENARTLQVSAQLAQALEAL